MAIIDDVISVAKDAAGTAKKITVEFVDSSKLKLNRSEARSALKKKYEALGRTVYAVNKKDGDIKAVVDESSPEIDELIAKIDELDEKINELKNIVKCEACGTLNPDTSKHCSECGEKIQ